MEYTKLTLEMTSPEYTDLHRALPESERDRLSREQRALHKGISADLIDEIHELHYGLTAHGRELPSRLLTATAVTGARRDGDGIVLDLAHSLTGQTAEHRTGAVVAATGYRPRDADLLAPLGQRVRRDGAGRLDVARDYTVDDAGRLHVLGTEEHTHGVTAPDLGFGAWRASTVLAAVTGSEPYPIERHIAFQTFGLPAAH
jgi:lysine N6-hydroxylase